MLYLLDREILNWTRHYLLSLSLQAVIALMEMGFDEKEVVDALRVNNNQQDAAVGLHVHVCGVYMQS